MPEILEIRALITLLVGAVLLGIYLYRKRSDAALLKKWSHALDSYYRVVMEAVGDSDYSFFLPRLKPDFRHMVATMVVEKEIDNGGFVQLFFNSTREAVPFAVEGYRAINAPLHAEFLEKALKQFREEQALYETKRQKWATETGHKKRWEHFRSLYKLSKLSDLEKEWWLLPHKEDPVPLRALIIATPENMRAISHDSIFLPVKSPDHTKTSGAKK